MWFADSYYLLSTWNKSASVTKSAGISLYVQLCEDKRGVQGAAQPVTHIQMFQGNNPWMTGGMLFITQVRWGVTTAALPPQLIDTAARRGPSGKSFCSPHKADRIVCLYEVVIYRRWPSVLLSRIPAQSWFGATRRRKSIGDLTKQTLPVCFIFLTFPQHPLF